jgi:twitching motility protein PilT
VRESGFYGMQTFDQSLHTLVTRGLVSVEDAMDTASNRHDFELMLQQSGVGVSVSSE